MSLIIAGTMNIPNLHDRNPSSIYILHTSGILIKAFAKLGLKEWECDLQSIENGRKEPWFHDRFYFTVETKYIPKEMKCLSKWLIQYMSKRGLITERLLFH